MPKYLLQASYAARGEEGVRAKGGTNRRDAVADTVRSVGGKLGHLLRVRRPRRPCDRRSSRQRGRRSHVLIENSTGALRVTTTVLLTPEQVDEASQRAVSYRPPGLWDPVSAPGPAPAIGAFLPLDGKNAPIAGEDDVLRYIALLPSKEQRDAPSTLLTTLANRPAEQPRA